MAQKDLFNSSEIRPTIEPEVYTSTEIGIVIDTQGFESLTYLIQSGVLTTGTWTPLIEDADDFAFTQNVATVTSDFLLGTIAQATFIVTDDNLTKKIGVISKKRFIRLTLTGTSTPNGLIGASGLLGSPLHSNITSP